MAAQTTLLLTLVLLTLTATATAQSVPQGLVPRGFVPRLEPTCVDPACTVGAPLPPMEPTCLDPGCGVVAPLPRVEAIPEVLVVGSDGHPVCSLTVPASGKEMEVTVTGTYFYAYHEGRTADAAWRSEAQAWGQPEPLSPDVEWGFLRVFTRNVGNPAAGLEYQSTHTYHFQLVGDGNRFCFVIADSFYPDNIGALTVTMRPFF